MNRINDTWRVFISYMLIIFFILVASGAFAQTKFCKEDICVVEFNDDWNKNNQNNNQNTNNKNKNDWKDWNLVINNNFSTKKKRNKGIKKILEEQNYENPLRYEQFNL